MINRIITIALFTLFISLSGYTEMTVTIGQSEACPYGEVVVPVTGTGFVDVAAITMFIGYDPEVVEFVTLENIHPSLESALIYNAMTEPEVQIGISWSNLNGINITEATLFDIRFYFFGGSCELPFNPGYEFVRSDLTIISDVILNPGAITPAIEIFTQPLNMNVEEGSSADFWVEAGGGIAYHWLENTGDGWNYLSEGDIYTGVNSDHLKIFEVPLTLDSVWYRCELIRGDCLLYSDSAQLTVDSSTSVIAYHDQIQQNIRFITDINSGRIQMEGRLFEHSQAGYVLYDCHGRVIWEVPTFWSGSGHFTYSTEMPERKGNLYFLQLIIRTDGQVVTLCRKIFH